MTCLITWSSLFIKSVSDCKFILEWIGLLRWQADTLRLKFSTNFKEGCSACNITKFQISETKESFSPTPLYSPLSFWSGQELNWLLVRMSIFKLSCIWSWADVVILRNILNHVKHNFVIFNLLKGKWFALNSVLRCSFSACQMHDLEISDGVQRTRGQCYRKALKPDPIKFRISLRWRYGS